MATIVKNFIPLCQKLDRPIPDNTKEVILDSGEIAHKVPTDFLDISFNANANGVQLLELFPGYVTNVNTTTLIIDNEPTEFQLLEFKEPETVILMHVGWLKAKLAHISSFGDFLEDLESNAIDSFVHLGYKCIEVNRAHLTAKLEPFLNDPEFAYAQTFKQCLNKAHRFLYLDCSTLLDVTNQDFRIVLNWGDVASYAKTLYSESELMQVTRTYSCADDTVLYFLRNDFLAEIAYRLYVEDRYVLFGVCSIIGSKKSIEYSVLNDKRYSNIFSKSVLFYDRNRFGTEDAKHIKTQIEHGLKLLPEPFTKVAVLWPSKFEPYVENLNRYLPVDSEYTADKLLQMTNNENTLVLNLGAHSISDTKTAANVSIESVSYGEACSHQDIDYYAPSLETVWFFYPMYKTTNRKDIPLETFGNDVFAEYDPETRELRTVVPFSNYYRNPKNESQELIEWLLTELNSFLTDKEYANTLLERKEKAIQESCTAAWKATLDKAITAKQSEIESASSSADTYFRRYIETHRIMETRLSELAGLKTAVCTDKDNFLIDICKFPQVKSAGFMLAGGDVFIIETNPIVVKDDRTDNLHVLGRFRITIDYYAGEIKFLNRNGTKYIPRLGNYMAAPHINSASGPCWGNMAETIALYISSRNHLMLVSCLIEFLQTAITKDYWGACVAAWPILNDDGTIREVEESNESEVFNSASGRDEEEDYDDDNQEEDYDDDNQEEDYDDEYVEEEEEEQVENEPEENDEYM